MTWSNHIGRANAALRENLLIAATSFSCGLPVRRAKKIDPMEALRYE